MAGRTSRLGLSIVGGDAGGTLTEDGQKYTSADRVTIDRSFQILEGNDYKHRPVAQLQSLAPTGVTVPGGRLAGGQTLYYRVGMIGADGMEQAAGPELTVALPPLLLPPGVLSSGINEQEPLPTGTLPGGFYQYALTAMREDEETTLGPTLAVTVPAGTGAVRLVLPAFGDADAVRLWRLGESDAGYTRVAVIPSGTMSFVDDGSVVADPCACDPANLPPQFNVGADYSVEVTLHPQAVIAAGWRLYRSTTSGRYSTSSLVHQVVELEDEFDLESGILRSWVDPGEELGLGAPRDGQLDLRPRAFTFDTAATLPAPAGYPEMYPFVHQGTLYLLRSGAWVAVSGGGGGGGGLPSIQTSPNGDRWIQTVDDTGAIVMVKTDFPGPPAPVQNVTVA